MNNEVIDVQPLVKNPFLRFPRNEKCICDSGHKWRRCHALKIKKMIPRDEAEKVNAFLKQRFGL